MRKVPDGVLRSILVRSLLAFLVLAAPVCADWTLYTCAATTKNYVVGAKLPPSGLFERRGPGDWRLTGHPTPFTFALEYDPRDASIVYVAGGNGLLRVPRHGSTWKILTAEDVTEVRDVSLSPEGKLYFSHSHGIRVSADKGATWKELAAKLPRKYCDAVRADRSKEGAVFAGCEDGIWRSADAGSTWKRAGASGVQVMRLEQSPHDKCLWLAGTQEAGLFISTDCGQSFENHGAIAVGQNINDISFDPTTPTRVAIAGWGVGVAVSDDLGKTWSVRSKNLPTSEIWSIAFDPGKPGRLYANVHEDGLYVSDDAGATWARDGLEGTIVSRMKFVPQEAKR